MIVRYINVQNEELHKQSSMTVDCTLLTITNQGSRTWSQCAPPSDSSW